MRQLAIYTFQSLLLTVETQKKCILNSIVWWEQGFAYSDSSKQAEPQILSLGQLTETGGDKQDQPAVKVITRSKFQGTDDFI